MPESSSCLANDFWPSDREEGGEGSNRAEAASYWRPSSPRRPGAFWVGLLTAIPEKCSVILYRPKNLLLRGNFMWLQPSERLCFRLFEERETETETKETGMERDEG